MIVIVDAHTLKFDCPSRGAILSNFTVVGLSMASSLTFLEKLNPGFFPDDPDASPEPGMSACGSDKSGNGRCDAGGSCGYEVSDSPESDPVMHSF